MGHAMSTPTFSDVTRVRRSASVTLLRCGSKRCAPGTCDHQDDRPLRRSARSPAEVAVVPRIVEETLASPGHPLDPSTRDRVESRLGHDFGRVRVHTGARAAASAEAVDALAYTVGSDVVFGGGRYAPEREDGMRLLLHELTHVTQQSGTSSASGGVVMGGPAEAHLEAQAEAVAGASAGGLVSSGPGPTSPTLQRQGGGGGGAPPADHRFASNGVSVVVRRSCEPAAFGFAVVEGATKEALDKIFNSECIGKDRRERIQKNLTKNGLDLRCKASAALDNKGACAESTGFSIPANILTLGSKTFPGNPDVSAGCLPLASTILHEIIHLTRGVATEALPTSCEASCFGAGASTPDLCLASVLVGG